MSALFPETILWFAVLWPLLLAIPARNSHLPNAGHLAMLPLIPLVLYPADSSLTIPWLLLGTSFTLDDDSRWLLVATSLTWLLAATRATRPKHAEYSKPPTTLFLLTLSGNIGVILAADMVTFFLFSTLMGYGYYGMLIHSGNDQAHHTGRIYLACLVAADLALFDAILLAASVTKDLQFSTMPQIIGQASFSQFYLGMVIAAFALKAGIWPFSLWLSCAYRSMPSSITPLLGTVPAAAGLLGIIRWLPAGEHGFDEWGSMTVILGVIAVLYAGFRSVSDRHSACAAIALSGLFTVMTGARLIYPTAWESYNYLAFRYLAVSVLFLAVLTIRSGNKQDDHQFPDKAFQRIKRLYEPANNTAEIMVQWVKAQTHRALALKAEAWHKLLQYADAARRLKPQGHIDEWSTRITITVILGFLLAWLMI